MALDITVSGRGQREKETPGLEFGALLVLDWQEFFVSPSSRGFVPAAASADRRLRSLVAAFKDAGRPVIATCHGHTAGDGGPFLNFYSKLIYMDDPLAKLAPWLGEASPEVLWKDTYSAFQSSPLAESLISRGVKTVYIAGLQTDKCVVANALAAFDSGFDVVVVRDACATRSLARQEQALALLSRSCARVVTTAELLPGFVFEVENPVGPLGEVELAIIGAGPAGLSAFLQARRLGLDPVVVERGRPGGSVWAARRVDNFIAGPGISGPALAESMAAQATAAGLSLRQGRVTALRYISPDVGGAIPGSWSIEEEVGAPWASRAVILAVGQEPLLPEPVNPLIGKPYLLLPGGFVPGDWKEKTVLVLGGGDVALDQAMLLSECGANVEVRSRGEVRALGDLRREAGAMGISIEEGWSITDVSDEGQLLVRFRDAGSREAVREADAILVCCGKVPAPPQIVAGGPEACPFGDLVGSLSPLPGLFLAGDLWRGRGRQIAIAAGDGCGAALAAARYLSR